MVLKYVISPYPTLLEDMVVKIWEAQSDGPGAEVQTYVIPQPHNAPYTLTANGLDKVVHIVRMYSAVSAALLHEYNVEPRSEVVTIFDPIRFKIGDGNPNTPAAGTQIYQNDLLIGLDGSKDYLIYRNGYGFLFPDLHYVWDSGLGNWTLIGDDIFNDDPNGEEFTIMLKPQLVSNVVNDSVVGKWFGGFYDITANINFDTTLHLRKLGRFSGNAEFTFAALAAVPIGYGFCFNHFGTAAGTGKVKFLNAPLKWGNTTKTELEIPQYTEACFVFDGIQWHVVYFTDTRFVNAGAAQPPLKVMGAGVYNYGDVHVGDPAREIIHNLAITGDYLVLMCIKSNAAATAHRNDRIGYSWFHHATDKPNKFMIMVDEITGGETQDLSITWTIIKL